MAVFCVYKPKKMTSYQCVERFRTERGFGPEVVLGYAGRLDPMAEGLFLILEGEDNKRQAEFFGLDKEYEAELVFGIRTDSYDVLGLPDLDFRPSAQFTEKNALGSVLEPYIGTFEQEVPAYSAVRVAGKPLFWWAKQGRLAEIEIPRYPRTIHEIEILSLKTVGSAALQEEIRSAISGIEGHFRQQEIVDAWRVYFAKNVTDDFISAHLRIACSSGTFIRQLVHDIGRDLGCGAIVTRLVRTKIGEYAEK